MLILRASNILHYVSMVADLAMLRRIAATAQEIAGIALGEPGDPGEFAQDALSMLSKATTRGSVGLRVASAPSGLDRVWATYRPGQCDDWNITHEYAELVQGYS